MDCRRPGRRDPQTPAGGLPPGRPREAAPTSQPTGSQGQGRRSLVRGTPPQHRGGGEEPGGQESRLTSYNSGARSRGHGESSSAEEGKTRRPGAQHRKGEKVSEHDEEHGRHRDQEHVGAHLHTRVQEPLPLAEVQP